MPFQEQLRAAVKSSIPVWSGTKFVNKKLVKSRIHYTAQGKIKETLDVSTKKSFFEIIH